MFKLQMAALMMSIGGIVLLPTQLAARPAPPPTTHLVKIYKYQGSLQCQGGGLSLKQMRQQLLRAGIKAVKSSCGVDGMIYPAVCGAPDGKINIFTINSKSLVKAQSQGFDLLKNLPDAQSTNCKL